MERLNAACESPGASQRATLRRLLYRHGSTDILRRHGVDVSSLQGSQNGASRSAGSSDGAASEEEVRRHPLGPSSEGLPAAPACHLIALHSEFLHESACS